MQLLSYLPHLLTGNNVKQDRKQLFEQAPNRGRAIQESSREGSALRNNAVKIYLTPIELITQLKTRRVKSPKSERV
jgi:hypothetical protein